MTHLVQRVFSEESRRLGLTSPQAQLMCQLTEGPVGMTELSKSLHLERSSLSGLVDRVERRALVRRVPDDCDRRVNRIALTEEGDRLAHEVHEAISKQLEELTGAARVADADAMTTALLRIVEHYDSTRL